MTNTTAAPSARYAVRGTTDDVTTCGQCGKPDLAATVIIGILDADGNTEDVMYAGTTCAAKMTGIRAAHITRAATAADYTAAARLRWAAEKIAAFGHAEGSPLNLALAWFHRNPVLAGRPEWTVERAAEDAARFLRWGREMTAARGIPTAGCDWPAF